jgi:hypothetical protein
MIQGDTRRNTHARPLCDLAPSGEFLLLARFLCPGFDSLGIAAVSQVHNRFIFAQSPGNPTPQCSP